jgi:hypothetical protein
MNKDRSELKRILEDYEKKAKVNYKDQDALMISELIARGLLNEGAFIESKRLGNLEYFLSPGVYPLSSPGTQILAESWYSRLQRHTTFQVIRDILLIVAFLLSVFATLISTI